VWVRVGGRTYTAAEWAPTDGNGPSRRGVFAAAIAVAGRGGKCLAVFVSGRRQGWPAFSRPAGAPASPPVDWVRSGGAG
jgi:hypothetical protein